MALIPIKNGDLYRAWINYLCKQKGVEDSNPMIRTTAFYKSEAGIPVPLTI